MDTFHTTHISSLSEFINQIETRLTDKYRITLFRGQITDQALIPGIARYRFKKSRIIDERRMLDEFRLQSVQYLSHVPHNTLELMSIAQHYGLPTRLLDWTENAMAALYFAVNSMPEINDHAVVWVVSLERDSELLLADNDIDVFKQDKIRFFKPSSIIQRVASQVGWFSIHSCTNEGLYDRAEQLHNDKSIRMNKLIIKNNCSNNILETLEVCGVNRHSIFQDLDSLGRYVFEKYKKKESIEKHVDSSAFPPMA